jgi:site-specific DNA recombinase
MEIIVTSSAASFTVHRTLSNPRIALPIEQWPAADRLAWEQAQKPGDPLHRPGAASLWRPATCKSLVACYGRWLAFLSKQGRLEPGTGLATHMTIDSVHNYIGHLQATCSTVTIANYLALLIMMVQALAPRMDWSWLQELQKHTLRAMRENAKQNFWNGARPPFGYAIEETERRGAKAKKRLVILETEAILIRHIFDLALGRHGPALGIKAIVNRLNGEGISFRGKPFHISSVHRALSSRTYIGEHIFNQRCAKTGEAKPQDEWVTSSVPAIIAPEDFDQIRASLASRNPKRTPPRVVSGPTLLTGLARCGSCQSGMTIRTGKSGRYRYYTCAGCAQKGKSVCAGRSVSMPMLDSLVLDHLANRLFTPERMKIILEAYIAQSADAQIERTRKTAVAKQRQTEISGKVTRLLQMVANGLIETDDPDMANQMQALKAQRAQAMQEVQLLEQSTAAGNAAITETKIARLADAIRQAMAHEDPAFRKAYLRLFVDTIIVGDSEIAITGPKAALAKAATLSELPSAATMVPSFVREWRPVGDSNPCRRRERAVS